MNPIYNMLVTYAEFDPEIGYTQGMNFLAALIFLAVGDEVVAYSILTRAMFELNWREVYKDQLIMLINLTKKIKAWLLHEHKVLAVHLDSCGVTLEAQLSSPIMGLFANLVPLDVSLRVLDRFILFGEDGILDIIKASFES